MKPHLKMILQLLLEASILTLVTGTGCSSPLGMESGDIEDDQLTASTFWGNVQDWHPREARLENSKAWYPNSYATNEWLQIDLLNRTYITGIQTQGHWHSPYSYYASSFKLRYSDNGSDWITFQERGSDKSFIGNYNSNDVKTNDIAPAIQARFIRISAVSWPWWSGFAFRLELLGCELQSTTIQTSAAAATTTTLSTTNVATTDEITTAMTTKQQTTRRTPVNTYPMNSISSGPGTSSSSNHTSGNSAGSVSNQTGTPSVAIIGGAAAAGVVVIIAIIVSIFFIRRRRSKPRDGKEPSPQADEGTVDNIYYGGVAFAANGNASTNGHVSIGQSEGMVDNNLYTYAGATNGRVTTDQSEGMVDNHLYAGTSTTNGTLPFDQSEGTVDNHLYAGTGDACLETRDYDSAQDSVYYNVAHTSDEGVVENDIYC